MHTPLRRSPTRPACVESARLHHAHALGLRPPRYIVSDLLELAGYEPGEASAVAVTGMQTDPAQVGACAAAAVLPAQTLVP